jgi:hypothetical protein
MYRYHRGKAVCDKTGRQPIREVEGALAEWIQETMLTAEVRSRVIGQLKNELQKQLTGTSIDVEAAETELATLKQQLRNLAEAVAKGDQIPELLAEMRKRSARVRQLEGDLLSVRRAPKVVNDLLARAEQAADRRLNHLRALVEARSPSREAQELFRSAFPGGLKFCQLKKGRRKIWRVSGVGVLEGFTLDCDPSAAARST